MNGEYIGRPAKNKSCWMIELVNGRGMESVHSEHCRVESGAVVFTDGTILDSTLVAVCSPESYVSVYEATQCPHEAYDDEEDDDE